MKQWLLRNKTALGYIASALALVAAFYEILDRTYKAGEKAAETRLLADYNRRVDEARKLYEKQIEAALALASSEYESELARLRDGMQTSTQVEKVIEYVEKEIRVPADCSDFAADVVGVLDKAVTVANGGGVESTKTTYIGKPIN